MARKPPPAPPPRRAQRRAILLGVLSAVALWGALVAILRPWVPREPEGVYRLEGTAFAGTALEAEWTARFGVDQPLPAADRDALQARLAEALAAVESAISPAPTSEISQLSARVSVEPLALSPLALAALDLAVQVGALSGGAFDVTLGPAAATWAAGLDEEARDPRPEEIALLMARVGVEKLTLDLAAGVARKQDALLEVDLAPLAVGLAVDAAAEALAAAGHARYRVEIDGCVRAAGARPDGLAWQGPGPQDPPALLDLRDTALFTWREAPPAPDGTPTLDARTGRPADSALASVTVLHPQAAWAAALAHAIRVLGPEEGYALAEQMALPAALRVRGDGGAVAERITPALAAYLQPPLPE